MATAVFPVKAEHVAETETVTSRRERLEPWCFSALLMLSS
jgi:hypothetical protein